MASATDEIIPAMIKSTPAVKALRVAVVNTILFVGFAEVVWESNTFVHPVWFTCANNIYIISNILVG